MSMNNTLNQMGLSLIERSTGPTRVLRSQIKKSETESSAHYEHAPNKKKQFGDINLDCIGHIFSFLTIKDKVRIRKVCTAWNTAFKLFWRISELKVKLDCGKHKSKLEKISIGDFKDIVEVGGHALKTLKIDASTLDPNFMTVCINDEEYIIDGEISLCEFLKDIVNISTKIDFFLCFLFKSASIYPHSISEAITELIMRNRQIKTFKLQSFHPNTTLFELKDLPESVEDVGIKFFVEDSAAICDWLSNKKNLKSLSLDDYDSSTFTSEKCIANEMLKCATHDYAINIKVLRLKIESSTFLLVEDMERIAVMKCLEHLYICFSRIGTALQVDDFLIALSTGCRNLKKFTISSGIFSCKGINPILEKLPLTHLAIHCTEAKFDAPLIKNSTLRHLEVKLDYMDELNLQRFIQISENLSSIVMQLCHGLTDQLLRTICAAAPRIEYVSLLYCGDEVTDQGIYHLLTALSNLKKINLFVINGFGRIIQSSKDNVRSNVQDMTLSGYFGKGQKSVMQLKELQNIRSLTFELSIKYPTIKEIDVICSSCAKLEEVHFVQPEEMKRSVTTVFAKKLNSLLQVKPHLKLVSIRVPPIPPNSGEIITFKKNGTIVVKSTKFFHEYSKLD